MKSVDEIREELGDLRQVLASFEAQPVDPTSSVWLLRESLLERQHDLLTELSRTETPELDFVVEGPAVVDRTIQVDFLSRVLDSLQESLASIGQSIAARVTTRGLIAHEIRDATSLRLSGTFGGSFGLQLLGPPQSEEAEPELFADTNIPVFDQSVSTFLAVLKASNDERYSEAILDNVVGLGPRAIGHIQSLSETLSTGIDRVRFIWRPPDEAMSEVVLPPSSAERLVNVLRETESSERNVTVRGRLVGASLVRGRFELETPDGSVLSGRVDSAILSELPKLFNQECVASLRVSIARSKVDGEEAETYTLVEVS